MSTPRWIEAGIGLGANLGQPRAQLDGAVGALRNLAGVEVLGVSPWLETDPVGGPPGQPNFWNGAALVRTYLAPRALLEHLLGIEAQFGRTREPGVTSGPRLLDLDLLFYGELALNEPGLVLPHPRLEERRFVLEPLEHLVPDRVLSRSGLTVAERLAELTCRSSS